MSSLLFSLAILLISVLCLMMCVAYKKQGSNYRSAIQLSDTFSEADYSIFADNTRFVVVGCSSSGKSTLSHKICDMYPHLKRIELDYLSWTPGWHCREKDEFTSLLAASIRQSDGKWVIDGNYFNSAQDIVWSKAEVVIWLDYDFWEVLYRGCKRTVTRIIHKQSVCNGNVETWWGLFRDPNQGIPCWIWRSHQKVRDRITEQLPRHPHLRVVRLVSPSHCEHWLRNLVAQEK